MSEVSGGTRNLPATHICAFVTCLLYMFIEEGRDHDLQHWEALQTTHMHTSIQVSIFVGAFITPFLILTLTSHPTLTSTLKSRFNT